MHHQRSSIKHFQKQAINTDTSNKHLTDDNYNNNQIEDHHQTHKSFTPSCILDRSAMFLPTKYIIQVSFIDDLTIFYGSLSVNILIFQAHDWMLSKVLHYKQFPPSELEVFVWWLLVGLRVYCCHFHVDLTNYWKTYWKEKTKRLRQTSLHHIQ